MRSPGLFLFLIAFLSVYIDLHAQDAVWNEWTLYDFPTGNLSVSSLLNGSDQTDTTSRYGPFHLIDNNIRTAWVEGVPGYGIGESILLVIPAGKEAIKFFPGYGKNETLYLKNSRPARIRASMFFGVNPEGYVTESASLYYARQVPGSIIYNIADTIDFQAFTWADTELDIDSLKKQIISEFEKAFPALIPARTELILQLEILDIYEGSAWDDTCISEIGFLDDVYSMILEEDTVVLGSIRINITQQKIIGRDLYDRDIILLSFDDHVVEEMVFSEDKKWAILILGPLEAMHGRTETEYLLYDVIHNRIFNAEIESATGKQVMGPMFFIESEDGLMLEYHVPGDPESRYFQLDQ